MNPNEIADALTAHLKTAMPSAPPVVITETDYLSGAILGAANAMARGEVKTAWFELEMAVIARKMRVDTKVAETDKAAATEGAK